MARMGRELLHAASEGDAEALTRLLDVGAPIECTDEEGRTPLMLAVRGSHYQAIVLLIDRGASMGPRAQDGGTVLRYAAEHEQMTSLFALSDVCAYDALSPDAFEEALDSAKRLGREGHLAMLQEMHEFVLRRSQRPPPFHLDPALVPRSPHTDFAAAFAGEVLRAGELYVRERVVACDPNLVFSAKPFVRPVLIPEQWYSVWLALDDFRVTCALLQLMEEGRPLTGEVVHWELALREGDEPARITEDAQAGYMVDYATGCFMSAETATFLQTDRSAYNTLTRVMEMAAPWALFETSSRHYAVGFSSGSGDGRYPSYWGLDAEGQPLCLITDFSCSR
jgi:hypothetical protein